MREEVTSADLDSTDVPGVATDPEPAVEAFSSIAVSHAVTMSPAMTTTEKTLNRICKDSPVSCSIKDAIRSR